MKKSLCLTGMLVMMLAGILTPGCGDDNPGEPSPSDPGNLPEVPIPSSVNELLPVQSDELAIGLSDPIPEFDPLVTELQMMQDDGSVPWIAMNRHLILACADVLPEFSCDPGTPDRPYIDARPRLLHKRYWRKLKQVTLDPGTSYQQEETISYGTSTAHEESREFSQTIGVEVQVGGSWSAFSASVTASYEQTETVGEVNAVTFSEENTFTETYSVQSDPSRTIVYALWQLVDAFSLVDADTVRIDQSPTLRHAHIAEIEDIEFPNRNVIRQSVTRF